MAIRNGVDKGKFMDVDSKFRIGIKPRKIMVMQNMGGRGLSV